MGAVGRIVADRSQGRDAPSRMSQRQWGNAWGPEFVPVGCSLRSVRAEFSLARSDPPRSVLSARSVYLACAGPSPMPSSEDLHVELEGDRPGRTFDWDPQSAMTL